MKIGIITIHYSFITRNYGSLLQLYAMQRVLGGMSIQSALIKQLPALPPVTAPPTPRQKLAYYLHHPVRFLARCARGLAPRKKAPRETPSFDAFLEKEIHSLPPVFRPGELHAEKLDFDLYLAGSDQIWTSCEPEKLLDFAPAGKRIAYAASAAWGNQAPEWFKHAQREFPRFAAISVRETNGVDICRKAGAERVDVALDPTLLPDRREYTRLLEGRLPYLAPPYVLGYFLNIGSLSQLPWKQVKAVGRRMHMPLHVIPLQGAERCIPEKYAIFPDPYQFLQAFQEASCVITNSFHGTVFAIIMQKPFLTILQNGHTAIQNARVFSLLEALGLEDRIYRPEQGSMSAQLERPVNWEDTERNLEALRLHSMNFLRNAVQQCTSSPLHG